MGLAHEALQDGDIAALERERQRNQEKAKRWLRLPNNAENKTLHRSKALEWLINTEAMMMTMSECPGWTYYAQPLQLNLRDSDATSWPLIRVNTDTGSDALAACMFLMHHLGLNLELIPDTPNHGIHNDVKLTMKSLGLTSVDASFNLVYNLPHGPYNTGSRSDESKQALEEWFATEDHNNLLFQEYLDDILKERGEEARCTESNIAEEVWTELRDAAQFRKNRLLSRQGDFCRASTEHVLP